jgi:hypothetical protein
MLVRNMETPAQIAVQEIMTTDAVGVAILCTEVILPRHSMKITKNVLKKC